MHHTPTQAISRTAALLALALAATGLAATPASSAGGPTSRVIVTSLTGDATAAARAVESAGGRVLDRLSLIGGVSATIPAGAVLAPSVRVAPDSSLRVAGKDDSEDRASASGVRGAINEQGSGNEGAGVTVAVVDTGVADVHDLAGRVTHRNVSDAPTGTDGYGHGTFVAGLIAGDGSDSGGAYAGVAPAARILDVKVADGSGTTSLIKVLRGLQLVSNEGNVDVVNLSLSSGSPLPYQMDPLTLALDALWRQGITVVVPAGNDGPTAGTITSPGSDPLLLTAGGLNDNGTASRRDDVVADWSSRGPAPQGVQKPDLVAPGAHLVSLRAPDSKIAQDNPSAFVGTSYFKGSGTSFSTAITSGAVAALLSRRPALSPDQVKSVLTRSAWNGKALSDPNAAGAGALDLEAAYDAKPKHAKQVADDAIPGDPATWAAFLDALVAGDAEAAASSWSQLSPAARNWAASSWSALDPATQAWMAGNWAARNWAGSAEEWAARNWAAGNWALRQWAAGNWAASSWSAGNWAASSWSAGNWAAGNWAAGNWAAGNWAASSWSAGNWAAGNWAAGNWAASSWSAGNWAAGNWAAGNWAAGNWAAGNWAAGNWAATWR
jgi:serine protease AprX